MRILIIEDERKIANALKRALERERYAVDVTHDSDEGYAMASTEPYAALIIDRMLPGSYDGVSLVRALRTADIHTPVLFLTALGSVRNKTEGLDAGADDYLVKPFALQELLARVRSLVRRSKTADSPVLTAGDLHMDTTTLVVRRAGEVLQLTQKEYALLEYLLRNQERPLSKDTIISQVWDYNADILPNTVEAYIKHLRKKVDKPPHTPLIHTVRGFGYKLQA